MWRDERSFQDFRCRTCGDIDPQELDLHGAGFELHLHKSALHVCGRDYPTERVNMWNQRDLQGGIP